MPFEANSDKRLTRDVDGIMVLVDKGGTSWECEHISVIVLVLTVYEDCGNFSQNWKSDGACVTLLFNIGS